MASPPTSCIDVFLACDKAIVEGQLGVRASAQDKEFHFQKWFRRRLEETGIPFEPGGQNAFPDFRIVTIPDGYEVKALAWPGRDASFDANSKVPTGYHNARTIFYVFGRYPTEITFGEYPVIDLVLCHGDFLNAHHDYVHANKSVKGFGSYGDIMIRDRKMYVVPTPYALTRQTTQRRTLILPEDFPVDERLGPIGHLIRAETAQLVTGYDFDLTTNTITPHYAPNAFAGKPHPFIAYQARGEAARTVTLASAPEVIAGQDGDAPDDNNDPI
jgi:hypothetical protein